MNCFAWQDLIALAGAIFGAIQSSRVTPDFPIHIYIARFVNGLHISVTVAIFGTMTTTTNLMTEVVWVQNKFGFYIPLIAYAIIITMGMTLLVSSLLQTILTTIQNKKNYLIVIAAIMIIIDLAILVHMMSIF